MCYPVPRNGNKAKLTHTGPEIDSLRSSEFCSC